MVLIPYLHVIVLNPVSIFDDIVLTSLFYAVGPVSIFYVIGLISIFHRIGHVIGMMKLGVQD